MKFWSTITLAGALATSATAHSWVEQMMVIAANGTMVGQPGFARGNVLRSSPGFGDPLMVNLLPPNGRPINDIRSTDLMCKSTQTTMTQTNGSPRLQAAAGANVALRYQENGHVTLPQNQPGKPNNRGTLFVYGTTDSQPTDTFLSIHRVWNAEGTGGDKRGVLLSTQNFDDGQCYQINSGTISTQRQKEFPHTATQLTGADLWCQNDIQIPTTAPSGKPYTLYWVWDWPTLPGTTGFPDGKQEIYTTCMDVDVVAGSGASGESAGSAFVKGQDLNAAAISAEFINIANPTAVTAQTIPFSAATGVASPTNSEGTSSPASVPATTATSVATDASSETADLTSSGFSSYLTESASASVVPASTSAAAAATPSSDNPAVPFVPAGGSAVGETTGAPAAATPTAAATSRGRPSVSPIGAPGSNNGNGNANSNTGTAISAAPAPTTTPAASFHGGNGNGYGPATVTRIQTDVETIFQTKLETVFQTLQKRAPSTTASSARCSKTEAAYRLRARSPMIFGGRDQLPGNIDVLDC